MLETERKQRIQLIKTGMSYCSLLINKGYTQYTKYKLKQNNYTLHWKFGLQQSIKLYCTVQLAKGMTNYFLNKDASLIQEVQTSVINSAQIALNEVGKEKINDILSTITAQSILNNGISNATKIGAFFASQYIQSAVYGGVMVGVLTCATGTTFDCIRGESFRESFQKNAKNSASRASFSILGGMLGTALYPGLGTSMGSMIGGAAGGYFSSYI